MLTLYDAARCPYCARVRIVLADKGIPHEVVAVNLDDRPEWLIELNPPAGKVPVLEEDGLVIPESAVIMEYLDERWPEPPLLAEDPAERALARLALERFDSALGNAYYDLYFDRPAGSPQRVHDALRALDATLARRPYLGGADYGLADAGYVPWVLRAETRLGLDLSSYPSLLAWVERLSERASVAAERDVVAAL